VKFSGSARLRSKAGFLFDIRQVTCGLAGKKSLFGQKTPGRRAFQKIKTLPRSLSQIIFPMDSVKMRGIIKFLFRPVRQGGRLLAALMIFVFLFHVGTAYGDTFKVINTADSGAGSLRWAITNANANPGPDTITFQISGNAPFTINLSSALPSVTDPVTIDATTQPGYSGAPVVELNGASTATGSVGLQLNSGFNTVLGLAINRFPAQGIVLNGVSNIIQGNFIGTDTTGALARGNGSFGIWVKSLGNQIGGTTAAARNVISGGNNTGIYIYKTSSNVVQGNYIGISVTGANPLGNNNNGVVIDGSSGNCIGGTVGARNFLSGNGTSGVYLNGAGSSWNVIQGNYIGTDYSGVIIVRNAGDGITVNGAPSNIISGNVISGNGLSGVSMSGGGAGGNLVAGNYIGTDAAGKLALGNHNAGMTISAANGNLIGTSNVISGNRLDGIFLTGGASGNLVQDNIIGLSAAGTNALPNGFNGISISGASSNTIGGSVAAARNVISGNANNGVGILMVTDTLNTVCGNYIGTDATGKKAVANVLAGVLVQGCSNVIGGVTAGSGNVISGNGQQGIFLAGNNGNVMGNAIQGNLIGLDATGAGSLGNGNAGIGISGAAKNQIGGTTAAARNVISANGNSSSGLGGVFFAFAGTTGNQLQGNYIGTDASGTLALGNVNDGIYLQQVAANFIGGSAAGAGNLISANGVDGIYLTNASWHVIQGNFIGTQADGTNALGNTLHNVELDVNATNNTIGGSTPGAGNHIAFAQTSLRSGVRVRNGSLNNLISGNSIFSNAELGIDLGTFGVTANVDCETGQAGAANAGQNYPVLTNVYSGVATQIRGTLDSGAGKTYLLQFFSSPSGDPLGYGQGQVFLGQTNLTLGASCSSNFTVLLPVSVPRGWVVTATATDPANNTSEFSAWAPVIKLPALAPGQLEADIVTSRQISLSWTNGGNYVLEQTYSLTPPVQWTIVTNTPLLTSGFFMLTLSATNENTFYRLATQ
jgi:titin